MSTTNNTPANNTPLNNIKVGDSVIFGNSKGVIVKDRGHVSRKDGEGQRFTVKVEKTGKKRGVWAQQIKEVEGAAKPAAKKTTAAKPAAKKPKRKLTWEDAEVINDYDGVFVNAWGLGFNRNTIDENEWFLACCFNVVKKVVEELNSKNKKEGNYILVGKRDMNFLNGNQGPEKVWVKELSEFSHKGGSYRVNGMPDENDHIVLNSEKVFEKLKQAVETEVIYHAAYNPR
jgi:hypothetical protein